ncbi:VOC family protein [Azoarcus olearius]|uniref:Probable 3-methylcatechol 2,3-dioxygenase n=1 Tax=Azoarcus sp. (strain BH72) TaxID=418699 RepID=A1K6X8_AZOSB|nr:VOC family protein [Azoarcus olearius]CAL94583.1 probable 3-methylcatechol 2,3-dioxygenase [Azoarcus olearius]
MAQVKRLAYIQIETEDVAAWTAFARNVLACEVVDGSNEAEACLRVDDRPWRIHLTRGPRNDIVALGLEADTLADVEALHQGLAAAGHAVEVGSAEACKARGVQALRRFADPAGLTVELSCGSLVRPQQPFHAPVAHGGFVTGGQGLGHVMLVVENVAEVHDFYCRLLGFTTSDFVSTADYGGRKGDFVFMRCNERHHSLAIGYLPIGRRLGHLMLQVREFDDVGRALDRVHRHGARQTRALGRHINDQMFSFYVQSPSDAQIEYGWGGLEVDEGSHEVRTYDVTSAWGHQHLNT